MYNVSEQISRQQKKFGRGGALIRAAKGQWLTDDIIQARTPSIFADHRHESRSERYTFIPTKDLLAGLRKEGFYPVEVRQGGSKDEAKRGFTKHMIKLQRENWITRSRVAVGDSIPEVTLLNSHDGTSHYIEGLGIFRIACLNGLITPINGEWGIKVAHKGDILGQVIEAAYTVVKDADTVMPQIEDMTKIELTQPEQRAFGVAALALRFDEEDHVDQDQALRRVLQPERHQDLGDDLWRTFNRVQEHIVRGGWRVDRRDDNGDIKRRKVRPVNSIDGDVRLNRALWTLAEEMRKLKA